LRPQREAALLIDLGNIADSAEKYEMLLDVGRVLAYDAVAPSPADLALCPQLYDLMSAKGLPIIPNAARDQGDSHSQFIFNQASNARVALLHTGTSLRSHLDSPANMAQYASALRRLRKDCDLIVLVSRLGLDADRKLMSGGLLQGLVDLVIETQEVVSLASPLRVGPAAIILPQRGGLTVGEIRIELSDAGPAFSHASHPVSNRADLQGDVQKIVADYLASHATVRATPPAPPRTTWGYVSANGCAECHSAQSIQWSRTPHARSADALRREGRVEAKCLRCHSEYYRRNFRFSQLPTGDDGVQCATCHGDGIVHAVTGDTRRILRAVPKAVCVDCHNPEDSPNFSYAEYLPQVVHKPTQSDPRN